MTHESWPGVDHGEARRGPAGGATRPGDGPAGGESPGQEDLGRLPAKLRPPRARLRLVPRRELIDRLRRSREALVVVCAPAGAGKSTALRQWAETDQRPVAWVQLDAADDDPVVLLTYLARSLAEVTPVSPALTEALTLAVPPIRERILPMLSETLAAAPAFVLVLDDAHLLRGDAAWEVVATVLRELPDGAQLAIGSRSDPALPLPRLRAAGELAEFRAEELSLDRAEVAELLHLHGQEADEATLEALLDATEGWATGLQLACLAGAGRPPAEWVAEVRGDRRAITEYLTAEVLAAQPGDVQEFLLRTSVLTELTPRLCVLVTGREDGGEALGRVAREQLFLTPLEDHGDRYRYHHLFAETLQAELERRHPGLAAELHGRVAAEAEAAGDADAAVRHLLAAGDVTGAGCTVASSWRAEWNRGKSETVRRWLESFDDDQILAQPALTLTAGWVFTALDSGVPGERWCRAACGAVMDDSPSPDGAASLRSSQALLRATVAPDGVQRMRQDAEAAAGLEAAPGTGWHAEAQVALGVARWLSGATQRALHPLALGAREGSVVNPSAELAALGYLALIAADEAEWESAAEYEGRASSRLAELGFGTNRRCLPMLLTRVRLSSRAGARDEAAAAVDDVERILRHMVPHPWMALLALSVLGEAALEAGDTVRAAERAVAAGIVLSRYPDAGILRRRVERLAGAVERTRGAEPLTPAERRVLELLPTHLSEAQIAEDLFVSRNTVKTHLRNVYRKLGVTSRASAVARARETGVLPPC